MADPIQTGSEALAPSGPGDSCAHQLGSGPDSFCPNLTVSQNQTGSGLVLHSRIQAICGRTQPKPESDKLVEGWPGQNRAWWFLLAHQLASRPDAFNQNLTRPSRSDLSRFCIHNSIYRSKMKNQHNMGCRGWRGQSLSLALSFSPFHAHTYMHVPPPPFQVMLFFQWWLILDL